MAALVVLFQFKLGANRSVSRLRLKQIWSAASNSEKVTVNRIPRTVGLGHTYSLMGPSDLANIAVVESRLRLLLDKHIEGAAVTLMRMN